MQKRRGGGIGSLPLTEQDVRQQERRGGGGTARSTKKMSRRKRLARSGGAGGWDGLVKILVVLFSLGLAIVLIQQVVLGKRHHQHHVKNKAATSTSSGEGGAGHRENLEGKSSSLLHKFESLKYPLQNSKLILIYFGAFWCPICASFSQTLDEQFNDILLVPPANHQQQQKHNNKADKRDGSPPDENNNNKLKSKGERVSLVYVSSDRNEDEMNSNLENRNWFSVPFDSPERAQIKEHFKTCAKAEMETLGFERRHEIPTLIIVDGESHNVLTFTGVKDVKENGIEAMKTWSKLQMLSSALDAKFEVDNKYEEVE